MDDFEITPSGKYKVSPEELAALLADREENKKLRKEVVTLRDMLASALGNVSAAVRRVDAHIKSWLDEGDPENIPRQNGE